MNFIKSLVSGSFGANANDANDSIADDSDRDRMASSTSEVDREQEKSGSQEFEKSTEQEANDFARKESEKKKRPRNSAEPQHKANKKQKKQFNDENNCLNEICFDFDYHNRTWHLLIDKLGFVPRYNNNYDDDKDNADDQLLNDESIEDDRKGENKNQFQNLFEKSRCNSVSTSNYFAAIADTFYRFDRDIRSLSELTIGQHAIRDDSTLRLPRDSRELQLLFEELDRTKADLYRQLLGSQLATQTARRIFDDAMHVFDSADRKDDANHHHANDADQKPSITSITEAMQSIIPLIGHRASSAAALRNEINVDALMRALARRLQQLWIKHYARYYEIKLREKQMCRKPKTGANINFIADRRTIWPTYDDDDDDENNGDNDKTGTTSANTTDDLDQSKASQYLASISHLLTAIFRDRKRSTADITDSTLCTLIEALLPYEILYLNNNNNSNNNIDNQNRLIDDEDSPMIAIKSIVPFCAGPLIEAFAENPDLQPSNYANQWLRITLTIVRLLRDWTRIAIFDQNDTNSDNSMRKYYAPHYAQYLAHLLEHCLIPRLSMLSISISSEDLSGVDQLFLSIFEPYEMLFQFNNTSATTSITTTTTNDNNNNNDKQDEDRSIERETGIRSFAALRALLHFLLDKHRTDSTVWPYTKAIETQCERRGIDFLSSQFATEIIIKDYRQSKERTIRAALMKPKIITSLPSELVTETNHNNNNSSNVSLPKSLTELASKSVIEKNIKTMQQIRHNSTAVKCGDEIVTTVSTGSATTAINNNNNTTKIEPCKPIEMESAKDEVILIAAEGKVKKSPSFGDKRNMDFIIIDDNDDDDDDGGNADKDANKNKKSAPNVCASDNNTSNRNTQPKICEKEKAKNANTTCASTSTNSTGSSRVTIYQPKYYSPPSTCSSSSNNNNNNNNTNKSGQHIPRFSARNIPRSTIFTSVNVRSGTNFLRFSPASSSSSSTSSASSSSSVSFSSSSSSSAFGPNISRISVCGNNINSHLRRTEIFRFPTVCAGRNPENAHTRGGNFRPPQQSQSQSQTRSQSQFDQHLRQKSKAELMQWMANLKAQLADTQAKLDQLVGSVPAKKK